MNTRSALRRVAMYVETNEGHCEKLLVKENNGLWFVWGSKRNFRSYRVLQGTTKAYLNAPYLIICKYTSEFYMPVRPQKPYIGYAGSVFFIPGVGPW